METVRIIIGLLSWLTGHQEETCPVISDHGLYGVGGLFSLNLLILLLVFSQTKRRMAVLEAENESLRKEMLRLQMLTLDMIDSVITADSASLLPLTSGSNSQVLTSDSSLPGSSQLLCFSEHTSFEPAYLSTEEFKEFNCQHSETCAGCDECDDHDGKQVRFTSHTDCVADNARCVTHNTELETSSRGSTGTSSASRKFVTPRELLHRSLSESRDPSSSIRQSDRLRLRSSIQ